MKIRAERNGGRTCFGLSGFLSVLFVMRQNPSTTAYGVGPPRGPQANVLGLGFTASL